MFLEYFDNLREKPKDVRKRYAFFYSSLFTGLIVLIWVASILISNYGSRPPHSSTLTDKNGQVEDTTTLFNSSNTFLDESVADFVEQNKWERELQSSLQNEPKFEEKRATSSQVNSETIGTSTGTSTVNPLQ